MTNSIVLTKEGVTVQKELVREGLPMPAIRFSLESDRSVPVAIRMTETLPDGITVEDIGFHEEYDKDHWRSDGGHRLAYERVIEPGERRITVYFVREEDMAEDRFGTPPALEQVQPVDTDDEPVEVPLFRGSGAEEVPIQESVSFETEASGTAATPEPPVSSAMEDAEAQSESTAEVIPESPIELNDPTESDTEDASITEVDTDSAAEAAEPIQQERIEALIDSIIEQRMTRLEAEVASTVDDRLQDRYGMDRDLEEQVQDIVDEQLDDRFDDPEAKAETEAEAEADAVEPADSQTLLERLADELDASTDEEARATIAGALTPDVPTHVTARIDRIERQINELSAYTDALREFLDEEGTGKELLDTLDERMTDIESSTDELQSVNRDLANRIDSLEEQHSKIDELASDLETVTEQIGEHDGRLEEHDDALDRVTKRSARVTDRVAALEDSLEDVRAEQAAIVDRFEAVSEALTRPFEDPDA